MMKTNGRSALIVAKPGRMRDGLYTLLKAIPNLSAIRMADDGSSALSIVANDPPTLVLLGASLCDQDVLLILEQTKRNQSGTHCIVVAKNSGQQTVARANGADSVLLIGFSAHQFFMAVDELLALSNISASSRSRI